MNFLSSTALVFVYGTRRQEPITAVMASYKKTEYFIVASVKMGTSSPCCVQVVLRRGKAAIGPPDAPVGPPDHHPAEILEPPDSREGASRSHLSDAQSPDAVTAVDSSS